MKKLLCLSVLLLFPAISHAQSRGAGAAAGAGASNINNPAASGGSGGGSFGGGSTSVTPAINRNHGANTGVKAFRNDGSFELTEVLPWKQAVELGTPKTEKDLATIARESREQAAKDTCPGARYFDQLTFATNQRRASVEPAFDACAVRRRTAPHRQEWTDL